MKRKTFELLFIFIPLCCFTQSFEVPKDYDFQTKADYAKYEDSVIECVNWLLATPINQESSKRKEAHSFLMKWLTGAPNVTITIKQDLVTFLDSPDLMMIFMGGWAKCVLEGQAVINDIKGNIAGINAVIELHQRNKKAIGKNKGVEKYIKLKEKGQLEQYIESKVNPVP